MTATGPAAALRSPEDVQIDGRRYGERFGQRHGEGR
jgi:hypothetical protein